MQLIRTISFFLFLVFNLVATFFCFVSHPNWFYLDGVLLAVNHTVVPQLPQLLSRECFFYLLSVEQLTTHNPLLTKLTLNCKLLGYTMREFYFEVDFHFKAQMVKWWHVQTPRGSCRIKQFWLVNFSTLWVICAEQHALENPHTFYGHWQQKYYF